MSGPELRYRGDGVPAPGAPAMDARGERGRYLADPQLVAAVNTALIVEQPLLVTGEPGTGKTALAWSVATELGLGDVLDFHTRSDHQARDALYEMDHLLRFYHAQVKHGSGRQSGAHSSAARCELAPGAPWNATARAGSAAAASRIASTSAWAGAG